MPQPKVALAHQCDSAQRVAEVEGRGDEADGAEQQRQRRADDVEAGFRRRCQVAEAGADVDADEHEHQPLRGAGQRGEEDHRPGWVHVKKKLNEGLLAACCGL
jgi:hypothetical protein